MEKHTLNPLFCIPECVTAWHRNDRSTKWRLQYEGVETDEGFERTPGEPITVRKIWEQFRHSIKSNSFYFKVPAELIVATIATESGGKADSIREEPGFINDEKTPHKISVGLMQTLISTASEVMNEQFTREELMIPLSSIMAGTAYISEQRVKTHFDPPKVACAYNAGGIYPEESKSNRWKMRQYPIGSGAHADRFIKWFNDFRYLVVSDKIESSCFYFISQQLGENNVL